MAWNTRATYATTDPPVVLADTLQAIASDIRTWGGNVDAAGNSLTNLAGLVASSAQSITFTAGGTERARITSTGNVGIGTASPSKLLHLSKTASGAVGPVILFENSAANAHDAASIQLIDSAVLRGDLRLSVERSPWGADLIYFAGAAGATEVFRIQCDGLVGIGTSAPKSKLHVTGLPTYASNAAALAAGLTAGAFYTDGSGNVKVTF